MSKFELSEELFERCRKEMENAGYGVSLRELFHGEISDKTILKYFGSISYFLKILGVPFCRLKKRFAPKTNHDLLLKRDFYSKKYGTIRISKIGNREENYDAVLNNGLKIDNNLLFLCDDLQSYTPNKLDIKEFERIYGMVATSRYRAKKRKFKHDLSVYDLYEIYNFELPQTCPVLGIPLDYYTNNGFSQNSPSLDKIVPSKGYIKENVRIISYQANAWCNNMTKEQRLLILKDSLAPDEEVIIRKKKNKALLSNH